MPSSSVLSADEQTRGYRAVSYNHLIRVSIHFSQMLLPLTITIRFQTGFIDIIRIRIRSIYLRMHACIGISSVMDVDDGDDDGAEKAMGK